MRFSEHRKIIIFSIVVVLVACCPVPDGVIVWIKHKVGTLGKATYIYVADVDGDGNQDIVVDSMEHAGNVASKVVLFRNNGTDDWDEILVSDPEGEDPLYNATGVAVDDIDNDGRLDVVAAGSCESDSEEGTYGGCLRWFRSDDGDINAWQQFAVEEYAATEGYGKIYTFDPDDDGDVDIAAGGGLSAYIFVNPGNPTNESASWEKVALPAGTGISINLDDMNNDGEIDILSSTYGVNKVSWVDIHYEGGDFTFTEHIVKEGLAGTFDVTGIEITGDGRKDLVVSRIGQSGVYWYEAPAEDNGQWIEHILDPVLKATDIYAGDINNDGQTDLITSCWEMGMGEQPDSLTWFEYTNDNGEINWKPHHVDNTTINGPGDVSVNDINGDNRLDVVSVSYLEGDVLWYENAEESVSAE